MKKAEMQVDYINYLAIEYLEQMGILQPSEAQIHLMEQIVRNQIHLEDCEWYQQRSVAPLH